MLLLHGNPTSSFLWRHVLSRAASGDDGGCRWIAPDLIGMGASGKPDLDYRLVDHISFVDAFIEALGLSDHVLVGTTGEWPSPWTGCVAVPTTSGGVAFMEGHLRPLPGWDSFDDGGRALFQRLRSTDIGERLVLEDNFFLRHRSCTATPAYSSPPTR